MITVVCTNNGVHEPVVIEQFERKPANMAATTSRWYGYMMRGADVRRAWEDAGRPGTYEEWQVSPTRPRNRYRHTVYLDADDNLVPYPFNLPPDEANRQMQDYHANGGAYPARQIWHYTCAECAAHWPVRADTLQAVCERLDAAGVDRPVELKHLART